MKLEILGSAATWWRPDGMRASRRRFREPGDQYWQQCLAGTLREVRLVSVVHLSISIIGIISMYIDIGNDVTDCLICWTK